MSRKQTLLVLLLTDVVALSAAYLLFYAARFRWGWLGTVDETPALLWAPVAVVAVFWVVLFAFFGLYRERFAESRFDELTALAKVVTIGILVLFFVLFIDQLDAGSARSTIGFYWLAVLTCVATSRMLVRAVQKALLLRGHGVHAALIVGWSDEVERLYEEVARYPQAGLQVVGAVRMRRPGGAGDGQGTFEPAPPELLVRGGDGGVSTQPLPVVAPAARSVEALPQLIDELGIQDVLIALGSEDHDELMQVLRLCDGKNVTLKLVPDFYAVIGGMARTEHMYGLPLIEVLPVPMPAWEQSTKRLLDVVFSALVLLAGLPLWLGIGAAVWATSRGPAIYRQQRVGRQGRVFTMYKYRTMRDDAEKATGPVWATADDPRYTPLGRWLRKTRLDEVPQLFNVLKGEMSLVGPRPERPFFVQQLAEEIPLYSRRHRVAPGITGLAQVKWRYDTTVEDVRQKVKYDLFYIENMSLSMDLKILFRTVRTALGMEGQ